MHQKWSKLFQNGQNEEKTEGQSRRLIALSPRVSLIIGLKVDWLLAGIILKIQYATELPGMTFFFCEFVIIGADCGLVLA